MAMLTTMALGIKAKSMEKDCTSVINKSTKVSGGMENEQVMLITIIKS